MPDIVNSKANCLDDDNGEPSKRSNGRKMPESAVCHNTGKEVAMEPHPKIIIWKNIFFQSSLHLFSIYAATRLPLCRYQTLLLGLLTYIMGMLGITAGAHRLWTHRCYKAKTPLRILLMILNSIGYQNCIFDWSRDHRTHHKYSETDADPHNAKRGFFFSHVGWLLVRKHPDVIDKGRTISVEDLRKDPVVMFQMRYYAPLVATFCFLIPSLVPWYFWHENLWNSFCISILRYCCGLNTTFLVNSLAHMYGNKPYDKSINPVENYLVSFATLGEGFHNYHHTFPHDYSTSEFGLKLNLTTAFIDFMALLGQAYDLRKIPQEVVNMRKRRTGEE